MRRSAAAMAKASWTSGSAAEARMRRATPPARATVGPCLTQVHAPRSLTAKGDNGRLDSLRSL